MPLYDLYRETTTREHYRIEAETPEAAFAIYEEGDAHLSNDEVIDAQPATVALDGKLVLDTATIAVEADETEEPKMQTFSCKIGVDARAYFDVEIAAASPEDAIAKLREMREMGFPDTIIDEVDTDGRDGAVLLHIEDEDEVQHFELVPLDYEPFHVPSPVIGCHPYDARDIGTQFRLLRSMIGTTDPLGFADMKAILAHIEATLSPRTYIENVIHR